ncbi:MAG: hypothetical protein GXY86_08680 [Firmicutes bacterium]|nr:hypothetical protein [Bacillota bacterium]
MHRNILLIVAMGLLSLNINFSSIAFSRLSIFENEFFRISYPKGIAIKNDEKIIEKFKSYFENTKISYVPGAAYVRYYKITFVSDSLVKSYGYTRGNYVTDFGKGPGSLSLLLRIYETDSTFESFMETIIKDGDLEYEQFKKVSRSKISLGICGLFSSIASPTKPDRL